MRQTTVKKSNLHINKLPKVFAPAPRAEPSRNNALFADGLAHHQAGRLAEAERLYTSVLATRPDHFDSRHLLGVVYYQRGNHAEAVCQFDIALRRDRKNI